MQFVEIRGLSYSYAGTAKPVLVDVNLTLSRGDFVLLTGPSGCGKTTLCRCLNGLIPHFYRGELEGDVIVAGLQVRENPPSALAQHVGFVFQNPDNQLFALSVEKDVAFGLENLALPREEIRERVDWAMDITGITHLREKAPNELSGGEQQRVAIACILSMKPQLMVLDEPTSFLDPMAAKSLFEIIRQLNEELGLTIVLVEHRLDLLAAYVNRVIIMDRGEVRADGNPRAILNSPGILDLGIGVPKIIRLSQELKKDGIDVGCSPISVGEMVQGVRKVLCDD